MRTRKKKTRRTKTKIGSKLQRLTLAAVVAYCTLAVAASPARDKDKDKKSESYALVAGTVFRDPGFAMPGVEVVLIPAKGKKQKTVSDHRGEFVFRVPPGQAGYTLAVSAKRFEPQQKTVSVNGEERVEVTFSLVASSNQ